MWTDYYLRVEEGEGQERRDGDGGANGCFEGK